MKTLLHLASLSVGLALVSLGCTLSAPTLSSEFDALTAEQKIEEVWENQILATEYEQMPDTGGGWFGDMANHGISLTASLVGINQMFDHAGDEMPVGRQKVTHAFGTIAKVRFEAAPNSPYGGILEGADGLARFALAAPESLFDSYIPAVALKFFVSGQESVDILITEALPGQGHNRDFFARTFSNIVPPPQPEDGFLLNMVAAHFSREDPPATARSSMSPMSSPFSRTARRVRRARFRSSSSSPLLTMFAVSSTRTPRRTTAMTSPGCRPTSCSMTSQLENRPTRGRSRLGASC